MIPALLLVLVPLLPAVAAPLLLLARSGRWLRLAPWLPAAALALLPLRGQVTDLPWLLLETRLGLDPMAYPLLLLAIVVWSAAGWHARQTIDEPGQPRFFFFWLLAWCGNLSALLTLDAASFYAAYALLTFSAYGLVVHLGRPADLYAGRVYLWMSVIGEGLLLAALLMLVADAGNFPLNEGAAIVSGAPLAQPAAVLMLAGFGIKVGVAGLHMWLPLAHPQAPVPASAVLSGVILKAGLIGWLRFLPVGQPGFEGLGQALLVLGFTGALAGAVAGYTQRNLKSLLAYSSVSQMGILAAIVGLALLDPVRSPVYLALAALFALHHGLNKAALFISVDLLGARRLMRALLWFPAAVLAALPLTSGALVKAGLEEALPGGLDWAGKWVTFTSVATTLLMLRFLKLALTEKPARAPAPPAPWLVLLAACLVLPWLYAGLELRPLAGAPFDATYVFDALWPAAVGGAAWLAVERWLRGRRMPAVPPGDLLRLLAALWPRMRLPRLQVPVARALEQGRGRLRAIGDGLGLERRLARLMPAVLLAALLLGAMFLL